MAIGRISGRMLKDDLVRDTSLTFNTDTLVVDYTNGRIGIGTATPGTLLEVVGDSKLANVSISNNTISSTEVDADLILATNGVGNVSVSSTYIKNLADPEEAQDAATKAYVDNVIDSTEDRLGNLYVDDTTITSIPSTANHIVNAEEGLFIVDGTAGIVIPTGTSDERRDPATEGTLRYNTTVEQLEIYDGTSWKSFNIDTNITNQALSGDGSTTAFTLTDEATTLTVIVSINGTLQEPTTAYSVSGTTITFTEAPGSNDVIQVRRIAGSRDFNLLANGDSTAVVYATNDGGISVTGTETDFSGNLTVEGDITVNGNVNIAIEDLSNVSTNTPDTGNILKWDGTQWAPAVDVTEGGTGLNADTLDGFDGSYYLDYGNFANITAVDKADNNAITSSINTYRGTVTDRFHTLKTQPPLDSNGDADGSTPYGLEIDLDTGHTYRNTFKITNRHGNIFFAYGGPNPGVTTDHPFKTTRTSFNSDHLVTKEYVDNAVPSGLATVATSGSYNDLTNTPSLSNYMTLSGSSTKTGQLSINVSSGLAFAAKQNGSTKAEIWSDGTFTTTRTSFNNNHLVTKAYVDNNSSSTTNYVKTDSTGFNNNLTITKSGSKYYITGG